MSDVKRPPLQAAALVALLLATPASQGALFTYSFTGEVTSVSNPIGLLTGAAAVGAPVTGSFTYTDSNNVVPYSWDDYFTNHSHSNGLELETPATQLVFNIGGTTVNSYPSLSTQMVGNDNPADTFPPFFPVGDSFRYSDQLDIFSPLFDLSVSDFFSTLPAYCSSSTRPGKSSTPRRCRQACRYPPLMPNSASWTSSTTTSRRPGG